MDIADRAQQQTELALEASLAKARASAARIIDYEQLICTGCDYQTESCSGKSCDAWRDCLQDFERRNGK